MFRVLEPKRMYDQADVKLQDMFEPTETRRLIRACEMEGLRSDEEALEFELMGVSGEYYTIGEDVRLR